MREEVAHPPTALTWLLHPVHETRSTFSASTPCPNASPLRSRWPNPSGGAVRKAESRASGIKAKTSSTHRRAR